MNGETNRTKRGSERHREIAQEAIDKYWDPTDSKLNIVDLVADAIKKAIDEEKQVIDSPEELIDLKFECEPCIVQYAQSVHLAFKYKNKYYVWRNTLKRFNESTHTSNVFELDEEGTKERGFNWPSWWVDAFKNKADNSDHWMETAGQHCRNEEYYRGLVQEIGMMFDKEAFTSEDGSVQQDVLCAKVPQLVAELRKRHSGRNTAEQELQGVIGELREEKRGLVHRCNTYEKIFEALGCKSYEDLVAAYDAIGRALGVDQGEDFLDKLNAELMEAESAIKEEVL